MNGQVWLLNKLVLVLLYYPFFSELLLAEKYTPKNIPPIVKYRLRDVGLHV